MTVLEDWGAWLADGDGGSADSAERARIGLAALDTVGAWTAALKSDDAARLAEVGRAATGAPLFGASAIDLAAFAAAATRSSEIDDIHTRSGVTPGSVIVPVALSLAPTLKADSDTVAAAIAAGYAVAMRFGIGVNGPGILYRGVWPTYLALPITTAAVTARLLGLDAARTTDALGIALSATAGRPGAHRQNGARWLLVALSAQAGIAAAYAAADGMVGDHGLLDGDFMERAQGIVFDDSSYDASIAPAASLAQISIKPWCAAKQTVAAITGFRDILAKGIGPDDIATIAVRTPPSYTPMISPKGPGAGHTARIIGIDYQLALAALKPDELDNIARPDESADPGFAALMNTVSIEADESLAEHFPAHWPATVTVTTKDGREESVTTLVGEGDPDRPLSAAAVRAKAVKICTRAHGDAVGEEIAGLAEKVATDDAALGALSGRLADLTRAVMAG